ncbi:lipid IV(A) 3-deoxy-D-manno-octulosonic acid transferase [Congregibacter variabilis]|uniref:3-deoxy-D-manno-octulosonic acid transferase n=1 Tax=Congregibacter variabilis TaxID=3081200 RepID=A0ABZ0HZ60_9GAMM|nr:lipid IV(A) 3-deoxy-D-manno-octulosonic acid transferase [Congregibacter sp. IMCC43200]
MIRIAYSALFVMLLPFIVLRMLLRSRHAPAYRQRLLERFGFFSPSHDVRPCIWIHAVSLGETLAARPLVERLLEKYPDYQLLITTTTPTGSEQVRRLFGGRVLHVYAPWDTPGAVKRFLKRAQPRLLILMETELWPNLLHYATRSHCQILLANARLSARSAAGYARIARTTREMLGTLDWLGAQSSADADRFLQLGMNPGHMSVTGSIKFDVQLTDEMREQVQDLSEQWATSQRPVIIFASTHEGEEELALSVFAALRKRQTNALLLLAPRHPERFNAVFELCCDAGLRVSRRSQSDPVDGNTELVLLDSLGELSQLFGVADIAVIGGSFISRGGHNPLEAAAWGMPILCGPSMFNFEDITERLSESGGLKRCADEAQLLDQFERLLGDENEKRRRGTAALTVLEANRGALNALFTGVQSLLDTHR